MSLSTVFGEDFLYEDWPRLLVSTAQGRWEEIKDLILDPPYPEQVSALLDAVEGMVFKGQIPREDIVCFVKQYFQDVLEGYVEIDENLDSSC